MMEMWNWLLDCYKEGSLTIEEMEKILVDDEEAERLWSEFAIYKADFIYFVRTEVKSFLKYSKNIPKK
jgi:hypothetical protein